MKVAAHVGELMFASRVQGILERAGHDVVLVAEPGEVGDADLLVADLMDIEPAAWVAAGPPALGIYNHTAPSVRDRALAAGFAAAVPRSRFVREAAELVGSIARRSVN